MSQQELEARIALLEAREAALLERLQCVAHDLASPLTPVRLQLKRWDEQGVAPPGADLVRRSIERLCQMTADLAGLARAEVGMGVEERSVDLRDVAADAFAAHHDISSHELRLSVPDGPLHVMADPLRILQALDNLVRNAMKFTPPGGRIDIELRAEGEAAVLGVRDTGRGLTHDDTQRIFRPHVQARAEDAQRGSGLGLHIVRTIVERHRGTVHAASAGEGQGSAFTFRLPLALPPQEAVWQSGRPRDARRPRPLVRSSTWVPTRARR